MSAKVPDCEIEPRFWARVGRRQQSECWPARPGEASPNWKLTDEETAKVRELFESGLFSKQEIADIFEVTRTLVYLIVEKGHRANV